jgi:hypothetical protein
LAIVEKIRASTHYPISQSASKKKRNGLQRWPKCLVGGEGERNPKKDSVFADFSEIGVWHLGGRTSPPERYDEPSLFDTMPSQPERALPAGIDEIATYLASADAKSGCAMPF